ncbi:hypothetical protein P8452_41975 [Trifolium repens]|nr:hypothetical protein P8452_41975 [Trifolium repens]
MSCCDVYLCSHHGQLVVDVHINLIHILNIVSATLVGSWTQIFGDSKTFQKDEVKNVQERCGNIILEHIEASTDNDMN